MKIKSIRLGKILNSRGNTTVEAIVDSEFSSAGCCAPSGASTGKYEVMAFPERGIDAGIEFANASVIPKLLGSESESQVQIDRLLHEIDGTENFSNLGGNIAVAISIACAKVSAMDLEIPLYRYIGGLYAYAKETPLPLGNVLGGGRHAVGGTDIQEFLVITMAEKFEDRAFANAMIHSRLKDKLKRRFPNEPLGKGDEGAWVAKLSDEEALEMVKSTADEVSDELGVSSKVGLDVAASELYKGDRYVYKNRDRTREEQINYMAELVDRYGLHFLEDPLDEEDFSGFAELTGLVGNRCLVCGDDLFVTNKNRLKDGIKLKSGNAILIKPNQIGTLTDTYEAVKLAHENGYKTVISHRSGETCDNAIAHLAVGFGTYGIKTGAVSGERIAKLNELIRIDRMERWMKY